MTFKKIAWISVGIFVIGSFPAFAHANDPPTIRFKQVCNIKNNGDIDITSDLTFSPAMYHQIKSRISQPIRILREFGLIGQTEEIVNVKGSFDDPRSSMRITATILGGMRYRDNQWLYPIRNPNRYETVDAQADAMMLLAVNQLDNGVMIGGTTRLVFPKGTQQITYHDKRNEISFQMPPPPHRPEGNVDANMAVKVRSEIMSCLGETYGNPHFENLWISKTIFRNMGDAPVYDFQVRFRLRGYSEWSEWKKSEIVYPEQSIVEVFYPIMNEEICSLENETPVLLEIFWSYRTPDGKVVEDFDHQLLTILGAYQVVFYDPTSENSSDWFDAVHFAPLVGATFVSSSDPIVREWTQMVARRSGVDPPKPFLSNQNALSFMKADCELMARNNIRHQSTLRPWQQRTRRQIKPAREVLKTRSGTFPPTRWLTGEANSTTTANRPNPLNPSTQSLRLRMKTPDPPDRRSLSNPLTKAYT